MIRIIARLDVKPPFVVKPVHFEGLRKIGNPTELATKYYEQGADEILYIDIVSSLYKRNVIIEDISKASTNVFIPFAAGGGVTDVDDCLNLIRKGVDKVILNTNAIKNPLLIENIAKICGSQAVLIHIEAKKWGDNWECYTDGGRNRSGLDCVKWAKEAENMGAGEIMISSVDCDGRRRGYDIELIKEISLNAKVPVIAGSGAGSLEDIKNVVLEAKPDAIAVASILHYNEFTIGDIKQYLAGYGVEVAL